MASGSDNSLHEEDNILRDIFRKEGIKGAHKFIQEKMHVFSIAVTGQTGTGKSSFVNCIRGLTADDMMAARIGVVETTQEVQEYSHPENKNLLIYDLPGIGGSHKFSRENYFNAVQFSRFDFYVIVSSGRFTELDVILAMKVQELGKKYYFVRSKIDADLMNEQMSHPNTYDEQAVLKTIRDDCIARLELKPTISDVFLVNNHDNIAFDFPRLNRNIIHDAPLIKVDMRERALSFLVHEFYGRIKENFKLEAGPVAMKSALEGKVKVPTTSICIEPSCITDQIENYRREFSLQGQPVSEIAELMQMSVNNIIVNLNLGSLKMDFTDSEIIKTCAELYPTSKSNVPLVGSFLSSRSVVKTYLINIIDQMYEDTIKLNSALVSRKRNEISESSSSCV